jgi:hypothetical protein
MIEEERAASERPEFADAIARSGMPSASAEEVAALARLIRQSASPGAFESLSRMNMQIDIRQVLPAIRVPTLVLHNTHDRWVDIETGRDAVVRGQLARARGREVDTAGDGFFAAFDGPARAVRCAKAIVDGVRELGIDVRTGLHTGECELVDGKVAGIAVHTGARVAALAEPREVLVSSTVKDLVAGSGLEFVDRGVHDLKGIPGEWRLYAAV